MNDTRAIVPEQLYSAAETQVLLGLRRRKSVYEIPPKALVPTWVGPRRGKKMFRGQDILSYLERGRGKAAA
ncbi:MAG: hypothetical protein KY464_00425 [Gemmatimonadetes bacterium]|nr:hypothetical protein [Gemmatimonadota bacterium]